MLVENAPVGHKRLILPPGRRLSELLLTLRNPLRLHCRISWKHLLVSSLKKIPVAGVLGVQIYSSSDYGKNVPFSFQRQRLISSRAYANGESEVAIKIPIKHTVENGTGPSSAPDRGVNGTRRDDIVAEAGNETENENEDNENNENDEEEEEDEDDDEGPYTPFDLPCKRSYV